MGTRALDYINGGATRYQVVARVAIARSHAGKDSYVYRDAFLPTDTDQRCVEHLLAQGLVQRVGGDA